MLDFSEIVKLNLTFLGEAIAFACFVYVCKGYIWPLWIGLLDARQQKIAQGLKAAQEADQLLCSNRVEVERQLDALNHRVQRREAEALKTANVLLQQAQEEAKQEHARQVAQAEQEIAQAVVKAKEKLQTEIAGIAVQIAERLLHAHGWQTEALNSEVTKQAAIRMLRTQRAAW